ncbi:AAA family ATPase [Naasia sp. SYSU D00057]|uniref:AAA family ATPase n=1 Tax=Naasia sp. SYSU D00057 TaxID=2817380 RepID=UPI001B300C31|nr:AAA family ATPase [Naasia sp. SYSU D00057]
MRLFVARVRKFKNVLDSGSINFDPAISALVGKNESGKSAILEALYRVNPVHEADFNESQHYPRWRLVTDRRGGVIDADPVVRAEFMIEDDDRAAVETAFGSNVLTGTTLVVERYYNLPAKYSVDVDAAAAFNNVVEEVGTPNALLEQLTETQKLLGNVAGALKSLPAPDEEAGWTETDRTELSTAVTARTGGKNTEGAVAALLVSRLPKMFYFADYQTLPGRINVTELAGNEEPGQSDLQTARALLKLAYTDASSLTDEDFEERTAELEAVSNELTERVFQYWQQNADLSIQIQADKETKTHPHGQVAVVRFLDIRVRDARHGFTNNFSQRSSGFRWFFSFLAAFSEFEGYEHGVVVLLDEPALTLHGRAQADYLRYIEDELAKTAQVVYSTHSPFMVDSAQLQRVRIVEDKGSKLGSVVSEEALTVGSDSLFPLQAALGYDIAQNLFVGPDNLLVEGTSDYTYIQVLSDVLRDAGRPSLDERWRVLPVGGASNIPTFVALIGRALDVTVLVDGSTKSSVAKVSDLAARGYLANKRVLLTDQFTSVSGSDIEDLFTPGDYLVLYNGAFGDSVKVSALNGTDRIVARIGRLKGADFTDHGKPADYLLRNRDKVTGKFSAATLDNFEALFVALNATLS